MPRIRTIVLITALVAIALGAATAPAQAKPKRWVRVITVRGADEQYTDQYLSKPFKLKGGQQRFTATVTPDPDLPADMLDWWSASFFVEMIARHDWDWAYMTMDPMEGSGLTMTAKFHLKKGRYHINPNSANCASWTATLWEKR